VIDYKFERRKCVTNVTAGPAIHWGPEEDIYYKNKKCKFYGKMPNVCLPSSLTYSGEPTEYN